MPDHHTINYIEFPAIDLAKMKAFYAKVFGWSYTDYGPSYSAFHGAGIDGGFDGDAAPRTPSDNGALVVLYSDDLDTSEAAIMKTGGAITTPQFDFPGGRRFHFSDPSGNQLAVWKMLEEEQT